jgi:hypothetical protein
VVTGLFESAVTFKKHTTAKLVFIMLGALDLLLTLAAVNLGLSEINPVIRVALQIPVLLLAMKLFIPVFIAWLMPGKLLVPSIILLALVVAWNIKELLFFIF